MAVSNKPWPSFSILLIHNADSERLTSAHHIRRTHPDQLEAQP